MEISDEIVEYFAKFNLSVVHATEDTVTCYCQNGHRHRYKKDHINMNQDLFCRLCLRREEDGRTAEKYIDAEIIQYYAHNNAKLIRIENGLVYYSCIHEHVHRIAINDITFDDPVVCPGFGRTPPELYDMVIRKLIDRDGYSLVAPRTKKITCSDRIDILCPNMHEISILSAKFKQGIRCIRCNLERLKEKKTLIMRDKLYEPIALVPTTRGSISVLVCDNSHIFCIARQDMYSGTGCFLCHKS